MQMTLATLYIFRLVFSPKLQICDSLSPGESKQHNAGFSQLYGRSSSPWCYPHLIFVFCFYLYVESPHGSANQIDNLRVILGSHMPSSYILVCQLPTLPGSLHVLLLGYFQWLLSINLDHFLLCYPIMLVTLHLDISYGSLIIKLRNHLPPQKLNLHKLNVWMSTAPNFICLFSVSRSRDVGEKQASAPRIGMATPTDVRWSPVAQEALCWGLTVGSWLQ